MRGLAARLASSSCNQTDQGTTWQPTVKVNAPPAKSNVFAWAEAGTAGNLVAVCAAGNCEGNTGGVSGQYLRVAGYAVCGAGAAK